MSFYVYLIREKEIPQKLNGNGQHPAIEVLQETIVELPIGPSIVGFNGVFLPVTVLPSHEIILHIGKMRGDPEKLWKPQSFLSDALLNGGTQSAGELILPGIPNEDTIRIFGSVYMTSPCNLGIAWHYSSCGVGEGPKQKMVLRRPA